MSDAIDECILGRLDTKRMRSSGKLYESHRHCNEQSSPGDKCSRKRSLESPYYVYVSPFDFTNEYDLDRPSYSNQ